MLIRDVRPDEYAAVGEMVVDVYRSIIPGLDEYADELRGVADRIAAGTSVWVADEDGELAGTVTYVPGPGRYAEFEDPRGAGIRMLAVLPEYQGRGIGEALVRACLERARADGRGRVYLDTTQWMETAQRLYRADRLRPCARTRLGAGDWNDPQRLRLRPLTDSGLQGSRRRIARPYCPASPGCAAIDARSDSITSRSSGSAMAAVAVCALASQARASPAFPETTEARASAS